MRRTTRRCCTSCAASSSSRSRFTRRRPLPRCRVPLSVDGEGLSVLGIVCDSMETHYPAVGQLSAAVSRNYLEGCTDPLLIQERVARQCRRGYTSFDLSYQ